MENRQEWRDQKAQELKSFTDHEERKEKLKEIRATQEYVDSKAEGEMEMDYTTNLPELKKEEFSKNQLERFIDYYNDVLEKYNIYLQSQGDNKLYLELLSKLTQPRGNVSLGNEWDQEEPITKLIRRMCTKAEMAILADYLDKSKILDSSVMHHDIILQLSHGLAKNIMYEKIKDKLYKELSILIAHMYETCIINVESNPTISAKTAASFYERVGDKNNAARVLELRSIGTGAAPTPDFEKGIKNETEIFSEAQKIVDKYREKISLEVIMSDLEKIHKIVKSLLE